MACWRVCQRARQAIYIGDRDMGGSGLIAGQYVVITTPSDRTNRIIALTPPLHARHARSGLRIELCGCYISHRLEAESAGRFHVTISGVNHVDSPHAFHYLARWRSCVLRWRSAEQVPRLDIACESGLRIAGLRKCSKGISRSTRRSIGRHQLFGTRDTRFSRVFEK